jgi:hypothetical protein
LAISPGQLTSVPAFERECFLIAPAGEEESLTRKRSDLGYEFIVSPAAEELEQIAVRDVELSTPGRITKRIIDHLLHARSAVADLTGRDPNVFYELAVRHAARLPVALIVDERDTEPPFDIDHLRVIGFDHTDLASANRCRQTLVGHLRAGLEGAVDSIIADVDPLVGAHRVEHRLTELLDSLKETLHANIASIQMVTQVMGEMDLAAGGRDKQRVEAALGEGADQAAEDVPGNPFVEVDPSPLLGRPCLPQLIPYNDQQSASDFLETIWREFADEAEIPRFKYGYMWVLRDKETGRLLNELGRIWARRRGHDYDWRQLSETGIEPGMRLEAIRPERRHKQHR